MSRPPEALALITCSSESLGLTLRLSPCPGAPFVLLRLLPALLRFSACVSCSAVTMTLTTPLFLLLLGLFGAQAATTAMDLRTAAAMGKRRPLTFTTILIPFFLTENMGLI